MPDCVLCCEDAPKLGTWLCGHSVCWLCALRLRLTPGAAPVCVLCQQPSPNVLISTAAEAAGAVRVLQSPERLQELPCPKGWEGHGVAALSQELAAEVAGLLRPHCRLPGCGWESAAGGLRELQRHLAQRHDGARLCPVCVQGRPQVFLREHTVYPDAGALREHESMDASSSHDQQGCFGHPVCRFCSSRQYDNEALYTHMLSAHEQCQICDRAEGDATRAVFYKDHNSLAEHCRKYHWCCEDCAARRAGAGEDGVAVAPRGTDGWVFTEAADLHVHGMKLHGSRQQGRGGRRGQQQARSIGVGGAPPRSRMNSASDRVFRIVFDYGDHRKLEETALNEFRGAQQQREGRRGRGAHAPSSPSGEADSLAAPVDLRTPPARGGGPTRGRGRGGQGGGGGDAGARPASPTRHADPAARPPSVDPTVPAVEFADERSGVVRFAAARGGGLLCTVGGEWVGTLLTNIRYEPDAGGLRFPQIRKRMLLPPERRGELLQGFARIAAAAGAQHNIPPGLAAAPAPAPAPAPVSAPAPELNEQAQMELDTLANIFGEGAVKQLNGGWHALRVKAEYEGKEVSVIMSFLFPPDFPERPPKVSFDTDTESGAAASLSLLCPHLTEAIRNQGPLADWMEGTTSVVWLCAEWVAENLPLHMAMESTVYPAAPAPRPAEVYEESEELSPTRFAHIRINEGDVISDRKSRFIAHHAAVASEEEVQFVLSTLRGCRRIAAATHPCIYAYRLKGPDGKIREGRDDDGESGAADKLLFMLQRAGVEGHIAVVTRWYGGKNLGEARFSHILNSAAKLLQQQGVIPEPRK
eukprot:TRINITY_DN2983_c2_g1_i1.p1 TRINITY_DN2983_c2_g1~~TRINITY_DN2983_c2_g1_i1.p1  ORF type:complete len:811 (+),score=230.46 TRINITY_DN2983_c2_g1_i1:114-2546(+)